MNVYDSQNVFAKILRGEFPCHRVFEDEVALAFMDIMPRCDGHVLVIPKVAARTLLDITQEALGAFMPRVQTVARAAVKAFGADGLTVQQFNESAGGQIVFHLHFHILPRLNGVPLRAHSGDMAKPEVLAAQAARITAALSE